jgi:hypothetical protein
MYYVVVQIGGIRYQRKPYVCMITTVKADADAYAAGITNAVVLPCPNEADATGLQSILDAYNAGWRAPVVVYNNAFNGATVTITGLSSAMRYKIIAVLDSGPLSYATLSADADLGFGFNSGIVMGAGIYLAMVNLLYGRNIVAEIQPRLGGISPVRVTSAPENVNDPYAEAAFSYGEYTADFTSLTLAFTGTHTGHMIVIEDSL